MDKIKMFNRLASKASSKASEILETLALKKGDKVLEIGVGGGYFANRFSALIGETGTYYGVDTCDEFLDNLNVINQNSEYKNIKPIKVTEVDFPKPSTKVNLIFNRNVYHHLSDRPAYFKRLGDYLENNGKLVIIDYNEKFSLMKLFGHYTKTEIVLNEMQKAGYKLTAKHNLLKQQSFLVFELNEPKSASDK